MHHFILIIFNFNEAVAAITLLDIKLYFCKYGYAFIPSKSFHVHESQTLTIIKLIVMSVSSKLTDKYNGDTQKHSPWCKHTNLP